MLDDHELDCAVLTPSTDANPTFVTYILGVIISRLRNVIEIKSPPALRLETFRAIPLAKLIRRERQMAVSTSLSRLRFQKHQGPMLA
jgi:hypothetical protein